VEVWDDRDNTVTTATTSITVAIGHNPASGTLSGTTTVAAVNGVATFSTLSINALGTGYTLAASATGLAGTTSPPFNVVATTPLAVSGGPTFATMASRATLVVRLHRYLLRNRIRYEMPFIPDPVAWTEVPETARVLGGQRERWHRALVAAMWEYKGMLFNPRYGRVGLLAVPFYTFGEMLAPLVEVFGYLVTALGLISGVVDSSFALLFVLVAWGYGMLLSLWAVVLEEVSFRRYGRPSDLARFLLFATIENFGYRQRTVWWRLRVFYSVLTQRHTWGEMTRRGFEATSE
jgi:hypothetical protein